MNPHLARLRAQVVTVSTSCAAGRQEDRFGPLAAERLRAMGLDVGDVICCSDDRLRIARIILEYCDFHPVALLFFTGGTGPTPDDVTPEAVSGLLDRRFEGIEAAIHAHSQLLTSRAPLSRIIIGARAQTVIAAVPGSPGGVNDALTALEPMLEHLLALTQGMRDPH